MRMTRMTTQMTTTTATTMMATRLIISHGLFELVWKFMQGKRLRKSETANIRTHNHTTTHTARTCEVKTLLSVAMENVAHFLISVVSLPLSRSLSHSHIVQLWKTIRTKSFIKFTQPHPTSPRSVDRRCLSRRLARQFPIHRAPISQCRCSSPLLLLLLLLFYSALISKVALRVPKIISNGITLNEMQSTSRRLSRGTRKIERGRERERDRAIKQTNKIKGGR